MAHRKNSINFIYFDNKHLIADTPKAHNSFKSTQSLDSSINNKNLNITKKILVYCHPIAIKKRSNHWLYNNGYFDKFMDSKYKYIIETVDTQSKNGDNPTHLADGFSEKFITSHKYEYDIVFVPDCGGDWYNIQIKNIPIDNKKNELYTLITAVLVLLTTAGIAVFSKFISPSAQEMFNYLNTKLDKTNYKIDMITNTFTDNSIIIARVEY